MAALMRTAGFRPGIIVRAEDGNETYVAIRITGSVHKDLWIAFAWARQRERAWRAFRQPPFTLHAPHPGSGRQSDVLLGSARLAQCAAADRPRARPAYISPSKADPRQVRSGTTAARASCWPAT
jgi:hypothetical protein